MNNDAFLSVKDLTVTYSSDGSVVHAVNDVSFYLEKGKTLGLVGETGAGKTTIAKTILRILPEYQAEVKGGEIFLEGKDLLQLSEKEMLNIRGSHIAMVFQDPMTALNPVMTIGKQIEEAIMLHERTQKKQAEEKAEVMLEMVGISKERFHEYPHQFSGGMKQRVVIAMALACNPVLLLADEPTTALDVTIQAQVLEMIGRLQKEHGTSMILITHDLGVVAETCDTIAIIYAGEVVELGTKEDIFDHHVHPYTNGLFGAIPDINEKQDRLKPVPGLPPDPSQLPSGCHFHPRCAFATEACSQEPIGMQSLSETHFCRCRMAQRGA